jgi:mannose-6-phosphate isomerase-like protein (cupin superfamily)
LYQGKSGSAGGAPGGIIRADSRIMEESMNASAGQAFVLKPGEGRSIDLGDFRMSIKASGDETAGALSLLEAEEPPGFGPPLHIHHDAAEAFYVLEGEYVMFVDDREVSCPAGSFIFIPAGMRHGFKVGAVPSRKLNLYFPAAMIGYFDDLGMAIEQGDVDERNLAEIARRHAMEIVGPLPERYV